MPRLATTSWHRQDENAVPWPFSFGSVRVVAGVGKAGASRSFFVDVPAGARIPWLGCRAGVRGGFPDVGSAEAQIGARMRLISAKSSRGASVQPDLATAAARSGRVCWRSCLRRHEHPAGTPKTGLCLPSQPGPAPCAQGMADDRLTRPRLQEQRPAAARRGQAKKASVSK
jgi:hypothetical protein